MGLIAGGHQFGPIARKTNPMKQNKAQQCFGCETSVNSVKNKWKSERKGWERELVEREERQRIESENAKIAGDRSEMDAVRIAIAFKKGRMVLRYQHWWNKAGNEELVSVGFGNEISNFRDKWTLACTCNGPPVLLFFVLCAIFFHRCGLIKYAIARRAVGRLLYNSRYIILYLWIWMRLWVSLSICVIIPELFG